MPEPTYIQSPGGAVQHIALHESKMTPGSFWSACGRAKAPALDGKYVGQQATCRSCARVIRSRGRQEATR